MENVTRSRTNNFNVNISLSYVAISTCLIGLGLNLFLLIVILKNEFAHRITYRLITISILSDILTVIMLMTNYTYNLLSTANIQSGRWLCRIIVFVISTSYAISILTLCLLAIGHYIKVAKVRVKVCNLSQQNVILISETVIIITAIAVSYPLLQFVNVYEQEPKFCDIPNITNKVSLYLVTHGVVFYILPSSLLILIYCRIVRYLKRYIQPIEALLITWKDIRRRKLMKVFIVIIMSDVVITLPFFISTMAMAISQQSQRQIRQINSAYFALVFFSFTTTAATSVVNPVLFLWLDRDVNRASKAILTKSIRR
ncbi:C-X-C chemokine receptor type 4 [Trichoplax sp. H2]|nr:C-X-C chemokine receptor type 4 [Trichoplax sp. H2]|eukprot:RDD36434.1 C-X-C chemokine receptor type 4 [Trichoplax sp. H2]